MNKVQTQGNEVSQGFGAQLRAQREEQGISLGDLAVRTRLQVAQLTALEEEDMAHLPEPVYVRSFIRSVAQVLRIDSAPLIQDYIKRYGAGDPQGVLPTVDVKHEPVLVHGSTRRGLRLLFTLLFLAALVAGAWYAFTDEGGIRSSIVETVTGQQQKHSEAKTEAQLVAEPQGVKVEEKKNVSAAEKAQAQLPPPVPPTPVTTTAAPANSTATPAAGATATPNSAGVGALDVAKDLKANTTVNDKAAEKPADKATDKTKEAPVAKSPNERQVVLSVNANCWVEIVGPRDEKLFMREMPAGSSTTLVVPLGTRITLGNAPAASLKVDGSDFDLAQSTRGAVARITLK